MKSKNRRSLLPMCLADLLQPVSHIVHRRWIFINDDNVIPRYGFPEIGKTLPLEVGKALPPGAG
jgi:hypothetical protein